MSTSYVQRSDDLSEADADASGIMLTPPTHSNTIALVNDALVSVESITETLQGESEEITNRCLARNKRRLEERWKCPVAGHTYCFADRDGTHIPLTGDEVVLWSQNIHDGEATLLAPPKKIWAPSVSDKDSDTASIKSTSSWKTITYQRPSKPQGEMTLTDLRSRRMRKLMASDSASTYSADTAVPGSSVGYIIKTAVNWGKTRLQDLTDAPEIRRRRAVIDAMVELIEKIHADERLTWVIANEKHLNRVIDDLLELSMDYYRPEYRKAAIEQATKLDYLVDEIAFLPHAENNSWHLIRFKLQPLVSLHLDIDGVHVAHDMREMLLQEGSDVFDSDQAVQEVALQLCYELAHGREGSWRQRAYLMLFMFYSTDAGRSRLQEIGKKGSLMQDIADRVFDINTTNYHRNQHAYAMQFFSEYAEHMPTFREYLSRPTGIPLLLFHLRALPTPPDNFGSRLIFHVLAFMSRMKWVIPILEPTSLCPQLVSLVISMKSMQDELIKASPILHIAIILRNISVYGDITAQKAVREAAARVEFSSSWEETRSLITTVMGKKSGDKFDSYKVHILASG